MKRHAFALKIKEGAKSVFLSGLGKLWPEITTFLDTHGMENFSIWNVEDIVFGYYETDDDFSFAESDKKIVIQWETEYGHSYNWISNPFEDMRLMYHDFGNVRRSKELIRHRVFITKLVEGMDEEYKARHDALVEARGSHITEGPDSNFSIWYAGGYIFGYDEIDTTMEHDMTQEEREATIRWETRMLEIMEWLTNDVDWITGEYHPSIRKIAWHS